MDWLERNLHAIDPIRHVRVSTLVGPGSADLVHLFGAQRRGRIPAANDTSCGVGYAPLTELERVVLAVEARLSSAGAAGEPALGEDVKVMAIRRGERVELLVACAMVDAALRDAADYRKAVQRAGELAHEAAASVTPMPVAVCVNAADDDDAGRFYLTVTGTSAEAGDDGQAGRGNRANGLIAPGRPMTMESVAGKNPVSHVGKLYNLAASLAAERIAAALSAATAVECRLVSRIGAPITEPDLAEVRLAGVDPEREPGLAGEVERLLREELDRIPELAAALVRGEIRPGRWPLRGASGAPT
jgi:S-adenosylmethionine synthetase